MALDEDLNFLKRFFLEYPRNDSFFARDQINFIIWELKILDSFFALQSFTFASECGLLDAMQKMRDIWKDLYNALDGPEFDGLDLYISDASKFIGSNAYPISFHVPTKIWKSKLEFRARYSFPKIPILRASYKDDDGDDIPGPKFVIEFIDAVEENVNVLLQIDHPSSLLFVPGPKDQLEEVLTELKLLRFFVLFVSKKFKEPQSRHLFFVHILIVVAHAAMVAWLYLPIHGEQNQMNDLLFDLQVKIKPVHKIITDVLQGLKSTIPPGWHSNIQNKYAAHSGIVETPTHNLVELPATVCNPSVSVSLNDQMTILHEMRNLLRANLIHLPILDLDFCLQDMDTVIVDAGLLIYSLYDTNGKKEATTLKDVNRALGLGLSSNIQPIKAMVYLIIRKGFQSNSPRIHGLGYVDFLLNNLKEVQGCYSDSLACGMNQLQIIQKEFESTQPFLEDVTKERHKKHGRLQQSVTLLIDKAYEVEYVVDACIRKEVPQWCLEHWLSDIVQEITLIKAEVEADKKEKMLNPMPHDSVDTAAAEVQSRLSKTPRMTEEVVGFEEVKEELRYKLIKGCQQLDVISIVGMPGLGKTTLANQLYSDESVVEHFDIRAQCCVSQVYRRMDLLLSILRDATGESPECSNDADAADKLRKFLLRKRYLILVDDLWEDSAWDDLSSCFCDDKVGSRIILTTRHLEVANYATFVSKPIPLRMFDDNESWTLLKDRLFGKESCPLHLENVGKQIAKKCGGLPLSVVLVAGILSKMEKKEESWLEMASTLGSQIHSDSEVIVEQSYQDLPNHLKPCFLYFGAFLEDRVINASMLTRLWISEAFIKNCEGMSLEDIAESYLENLIRRNLVMVAKRAYLDGKVKSCRIHDVLLEFCKRRAIEENFLLWIKRDQNGNPSSRIYSNKHHGQHRLAFSEVDTLAEWRLSYTFVGSVFLRPDRSYRSLSKTLAFSGIVQNFRFLKVLDLEHSAVIDYFPAHLDLEHGAIIDNFPANLLHLRYFSAATRQTSVPLSISNLRNLETLILKFISERYASVAIRVWKMVKLRHLHLSKVIGGVRMGNTKELLEDSSQLLDLRTLSFPYFTCAKDAELLLRKTPNLRELKFKFSGVRSGQFVVLDFPTRLQKLQIKNGYSFPKFPTRLQKLQIKNGDSFPTFPVGISASNLKKLRMDGFRMSIQHLSNIAQLQNLQALQLHYVDFEDGKWEVRDDEFPQLKVLKLISSNLEEWTASDDAFACLERLVLSRCTELEEIPSCFADISSLKFIEVIVCKESVGKSARDICDTQVEDYQNTDFKLFIKDLYLDDHEEEEEEEE